MKTDYNTLHLGKKEMLRLIVRGILLMLALDLLFYERWWGMFLLIWVPVLSVRLGRERLIRERKRNLNLQFKEALLSMNVAMQAGYSAENAIAAAARDLERLYGKQADLCRELRDMEQQMRLSVPPERLLTDFGRRSHVEDIENFAAVFDTARRTGGDMAAILAKSARMLGEKIDVSKEIEASLAARKSEQAIMSVMPAGILLYLKLTSPGLLSPMYGTAAGALIMTCCLLVYVLAWQLGRRIVEIEV